MNLENNIIIKYQPRFLTDLNIKNDIYNLLYSFINSSNINILIHGNKLTGKTSILNCIYNEWYKINNTKDIIYIDGLNDPGILYFRNNLKTFSQTNPINKLKKKIIIIDNLHYISIQEQNLLTIYINKYKKYLSVIVSCNLIDKVIDKIRSYFNIITLPKIDNKTLQNICNKICTAENIELNTTNTKLLINICDNSIAKLINNLQTFKLFNYKKITKYIINNTNYNITIKLIKDYYNHCKNKYYKKAIEIINKFINNGYSVLDILNKLTNFIKNKPQIDFNLLNNIIPLISKYISFFHNGSESIIELYFFTNDLINML